MADPIIYAVSTRDKNNYTSPLAYATVERLNVGATNEYYRITSRAGDKLNVDPDAIDALIAALIQARGPVKL